MHNDRTTLVAMFHDIRGVELGTVGRTAVDGRERRTDPEAVEAGDILLAQPGHTGLARDQKEEARSTAVFEEEEEAIQAPASEEEGELRENASL